MGELWVGVGWVGELCGGVAQLTAAPASNASHHAQYVMHRQAANMLACLPAAAAAASCLT